MGSLSEETVFVIREVTTRPDGVSHFHYERIASREEVSQYRPGEGVVGYQFKEMKPGTIRNEKDAFFDRLVGDVVSYNIAVFIGKPLTADEVYDRLGDDISSKAFSEINFLAWSTACLHPDGSLSSLGMDKATARVFDPATSKYYAPSGKGSAITFTEISAETANMLVPHR